MVVWGGSGDGRQPEGGKSRLERKGGKAVGKKVNLGE